MPPDSIRRGPLSGPGSRQGRAPSPNEARSSDRITRRDALQGLSLGALALSQVRLLTGCGGGAERDAGRAAQQEYTLDPDRPWWMQPPFAPVVEENEAFELQVVGEIPRALNGVYMRNGPNPQYVDRGHWFLGDGMLHAMRLQDGKAHWCRNRYVETATHLNNPRDSGREAKSDLCNVSVIHHAARVLALGEHGSPYEISLDDLSTIGPYDFAGRLQTSTAAHPKLDPRTGELHMIGYAFSEPYLTYHLVNAVGALVRSEPITVPHAVLLHDFQITASSIVILDHPVRFDLPLAVANQPMPFRWQPELGTRIGIMPRSGGDADITWIEIAPCAVLHGFNAYDDDAGNVVFDVCELPRLWVDQSSTFDAESRVCRYTVDVRAKRVRRAQLDDRVVDLPQIDRRRTGAPHRYGYGRWMVTDRIQVPFHGGGLVKYDLQRSSETVHEYGPGRCPSEPCFVPASANAEEDDGFVLTFVHELGAGGSLDIFDARALSKAPLASVKVPWSIPLGFHGIWVPG